MASRITFILGTVLSFMAFSPVAAQDLQKGAIAALAGDYATAIKEWTPLAEAGNASALFNLGYIYHKGLGVPQDYAEAVKWYRLAAEQGLAHAQNSLGFMYEAGRGVVQDNVMAHMWYNIASANGHEGAGARRDKTASLMILAATEKAQAMARECMSSGYTKCGY